jgi:hypothetical protein
MGVLEIDAKWRVYYAIKAADGKVLKTIGT